MLKRYEWRSLQKNYEQVCQTQGNWEYEDYNEKLEISEDDVQENLSENDRRMDTEQTNTKAIIASGSRLKDEEIFEAPQPDSTASTDWISRSKSIASLKLQPNATPKPTKLKPSTSTSKDPVAISSTSNKNNKEKSNDEEG